MGLGTLLMRFVTKGLVSAPMRVALVTRGFYVKQYVKHVKLHYARLFWAELLLLRKCFAQHCPSEELLPYGICRPPSNFSMLVAARLVAWIGFREPLLHRCLEYSKVALFADTMCLARHAD